MRGVSRSRLKFSLHRKTTAALACLVLTGCIGQKPSFPKLTSKSSSKSSANQLADPFNIAADMGDSKPLTHVSLNETASLGAESDFTGSSILTTSAENSSAGALSQYNARSGLSREMDEIDAAFLNVQRPAQAAPVDTRALEQFKGNVANVQQGGSHLEALKASLSDLNSHQGSPPVESAAASLMISEESPLPGSVNIASLGSPVASGQAEAYPSLGDEAVATVEALPGSEISLSEAGMSSPGTGILEEFPWSAGGASLSSAAASAESVNDRVRGMLARSHTLIQQNNLMAARTVAESAQTLLQKTQQVLNPGEVTPEQVLADIKSRQQQYEQRRLASGKNPVISSADALPVVIDLSREWVNTPAHRVQISSKDDLETFAEATVVANKPASLPVITPREVVFDKTASDSHQLNPGAVLAETRKQAEMNQALSAAQAAPISLSGSDGVVLLGEMPVQNSAPPVMTGGGTPAPTQESLISFNDDRSATSLSVPSLDGPLLVMPEAAPRISGGEILSGPMLLTDSSVSTPATALTGAADLDEFAADFAQATQAGGPGGIELAPLMIDELELKSPAPRKSWMTASTLSLLVGGVVAGAMLMFRWRR